MAQAVLTDGTTVELTPDNWNDLAFHERELRAAQLGRKLTPAESIAIIENFRSLGMSFKPVDDQARIKQAADSVTYAREAEKLYLDPVKAAAGSAWNAVAAPLNTAAQTGVVIAVAVGALFLWSMVRGRR